jgi:hypothetical protein
MNDRHPTQLPGDKIKKALVVFSELLESNPEKKRKDLLRQVEIQFDLSPRECEFLNSQFSTLHSKNHHK